MEFPHWVSILLALVAGLFGNEFLGRYLFQRQKQAQARAEAERRHDQVRDQAQLEAQGELLRAVITMVQTQSRDLTELLRDSLKSNQVMANNIGQLSMVMESHNEGDRQQFVLIQEGLGELLKELQEMSSKIDTTNQYTSAVVRAIGGNLEQLLQDIDDDKTIMDNLVE